VALPGAGVISFMVRWGEVLVGIALILGLFTNFAALVGITMNFAFLFSGTVSTNGIMILMTVFIVVAGMNAGRYGLDRWVIPYLKNDIFHNQPKGKWSVVAGYIHYPETGWGYGCLVFLWLESV